MDLIQIIIMVTWFGLNVSQGIESYGEIFMVGNKRCITNSSEALAISKPISNTNAIDDNKVSSYYPPSESKCSFEISGRSSEKFWVPPYWNIVTSIEGPVQHYVTDRRWEGFTMHKLKSNLYHQKVFSFTNAKNFVIPYSVRSDGSGFVQISLCHIVRRIQTCYCIKLAQTESSIWRCTHLQAITSNTNNTCEEWNNGQRVNFEDIGKEIWTHLIIVGRDNMVKVLRGNNVIMSFNDSEPAAYDERILYIHSQNPSLWKVHEYNYISTKTPDIIGQIGPIMNITNSTTCISMFVAMCQTCCLQFKIIIKKDNDESETIDKIVNSKNEMWTEETLIFNTQDYIGKTFTIWHYTHQCKVSSSQELFWAIDDIRTCAEKEYRYIESKEEKFTCQKLGIQQTEILKIDDKTTGTTGIICPEDTFGKYCLPCSMFGNPYCKGFLYCDQDHSEQTCHCTSGYLGECKTGCRSGFYGHGCENICSEHCSAGCSNVNGVCAGSCKKPYTGSKCNNPQVFLFVNPPDVTDVTSTSGIVQVQDFEVEAPEGAVSLPNYYNIEYGEDSNQNVNRTGRNDEPINWKKLRYNLYFNKDREVKIEAIKPDTFYRVRATINETNENYIKSTRFLTKCTDITTEDVTITPSDNSATIDIKWPIDHCRFSRYKLFCNNTELKTNLSNSIVWARIEPYTLYNCTIKKENIPVIVKKFRTDEGVPSVVQDVSIIANENKISISWKKPNKERGKILGYDIAYFYLGSKESSCGLSVSSSNYKNVSTPQTSITLEDLKFYSKYTIRISAVTSKGEGEQYKSENIETNQLDDISDLEMPGMKTHKASSDGVTLNVTKIACVDFTGPIYLQGNASCSHKWCTEKNVLTDTKYSVNLPSITITGLAPYSNYTAYLAMSRDKKSWRNFGQVTFQTKPAVPNSITNLEVISKDATSISLRWLKPYPPTGILEQYNISYSYRYNSYFSWTINVLPQSCPLWKEYHCGNLTEQIYYGKSYNIKISAKNKNITNYGTPSGIYVTMKHEASLPTYGISLLWDEDNDLNITWYHPNNTNGELKSFEIKLRVGRQLFLTKWVRFTEANYSLTYTKTVSSAELLACTECRAAIRVHNLYKASAFNHSSATGPPDIPQNISIENLENETTKTSITIHVSSVDINTELYQKKIYILVSKAAETDDLVPFEQNLLKPMDTKPQLTSSRVIYNTSRTNSSLYFTIGGNVQSESSLNNPPLEPGTNYRISIIMSNQCSGMIRLGRAQNYFRTLEEITEIDTKTVPAGTNKGLWALILLLLVPIIGFTYWYKKNTHPKEPDMWILNTRNNHENSAPSRNPNSAGGMLSANPRQSLPVLLDEDGYILCSNDLSTTISGENYEENHYTEIIDSRNNHQTTAPSRNPNSTGVSLSANPRQSLPVLLDVDGDILCSNKLSITISGENYEETLH